MADCCNDKACEIDALRSRQSSTLKIVLAINAAMFVVELTAGLIGHSISLVADSLDMLGDAMVYGFSLYVVALGTEMKAKAALLKGVIMAAFGFFVLGQAIYRIVFPQLPMFETISAIGLLALAANGTCFYLLWRHRADDINMSSVWLCTRNDIIANISVLFAAVGVWLTHSGWPDIVVGLALAALFLRSALQVLRESIKELRVVRAKPDVVLQSTLICPQCGHAEEETMPTDACQWFYNCKSCGAVLRPKHGDCCVFCSFGTVKCPPMQINPHTRCC